MKEETLSTALNLLSEDLLEETNEIRKDGEALPESVESNGKQRKQTEDKTEWNDKKEKTNKQERRKTGEKWKVYMPFVAAVLLLCLAGGWYWNLQEQDSTKGNAAKQDSMKGNSTEQDSTESNSTEQNFAENGTLPKLEITEDFSEAMGFEGYLAYEIDELVNGNPWREEMELKTLPVYQNELSYNQYGKVSDPDLDAMERFLKELAARLGLSAEQLEIVDDVPTGEKREAILEKIGEEDAEDYFISSKLMAEVDGLLITVDAAMTGEIHFEPGRELSGNFHYTHRDSSYEEIAAVAEYFLEQYQDLLGMEKPARNIYGGDYTYAGKAGGQNYRIGFYESSGDVADQLLQYHFYQVCFYCNDEGQLELIRFYHPDLTKKVGDYPLISVQEAEKLLENGNYITSVPEEMPGLDYVSKVELTYRTGTHEAYYMPYYRFYVELPDDTYTYEDGLKTYGAYYVPAVKGEYLTSMPVWDGSFD